METMTEDLELQAVEDQDPSRFTEETTQLPWSEKLIRNLQWIKAADTDPVYRTALEDWDTKEKTLLARIQRKSKESAGLQTEVYSLIGFYSVFQGVVLVAVSQAQPTVLQCRKFWIPVVLSVLASVVTFVAISQKHSDIKELKTIILKERCYLEDLKRRQQALRNLGREFKFENFQENHTATGREGHLRAGWSKFAFLWITLIIFAVVFPFFQWVLLCK